MRKSTRVITIEKYLTKKIPPNCSFSIDDINYVNYFVKNPYNRRLRFENTPLSMMHCKNMMYGEG